ncbi:MAG: YlxR family protein [Dehalococcoidales bacterium]|nr:YlxR family protein [Dehalococcoidales bacterium]
MTTKTTNINKHLPQRTCIACRVTREKRELIRLVRVSDGGVEVDENGKKVGRGAYLCREQNCWQEGLKGGRLEHALRTNLSHENMEQLAGYGKSLSGGLDGG